MKILPLSRQLLLKLLRWSEASQELLLRPDARYIWCCSPCSFFGADCGLAAIYNLFVTGPPGGRNPRL
jgi:hypothetical protein